MKKLFIALSSISFLARASEEMEDMSEGLSDVASRAQEVMSSMSWHVKLMMYWSSLSSVHKIILLFVVGLAVLWILCKLMHCSKSKSCSTGCHKK